MKLVKYLKIISVFVMLANVKVANSQNLEGGLLIGASNYIGDMSGPTFNYRLTKPAVGIIFRYNFEQRWALKGYAGYGRIAGADSLSTFNKYNNKRNLSFFTDIFELSAQIEYNLIPIDNRVYSKKMIVPYVFIGLGVFKFNPKTYLGGKVYELQPLATEGQGSTQYNSLEKYSLTQFCVPFGVGLKRKISLRWTLGAEVGFRYTFTNYLDDVGGVYANSGVVSKSTGEVAGILADRSVERGGTPAFQEGDKRSHKRFDVNDIYFFSGVSITFRLKGRAICPRFN